MGDIIGVEMTMGRVHLSRKDGAKLVLRSANLFTENSLIYSYEIEVNYDNYTLREVFQFQRWA